MRPSLSVFVLPVVLACSSGDVQRGAAVERDSAGIRIAESTGPAWDDADAWTISAHPLVSIGGGQTDEDQLFHARSALRLGDGRIVVANTGSHELRFYAADGSFLQAVGREGGGPGEFGRLDWVRPYRGDSIVTYDVRQRRVTVFDGAGVYGRDATRPANADEGRFRVTRAFADGSFLAIQSTMFGPDTDMGERRPDMHVARLSDALAMLDTIAVFPGTEGYSQSMEFPGGQAGIMAMSIIFARSTETWVDGNDVYRGTTDTYEIQRLDAAGNVQAIVRRLVDPVETTDELVEQFKEYRRAQGDAPTADLMEQSLAALPVAETLPAFSEFMVDADGHLWVRHFKVPGEEWERFDVFDPNGVFLGEVGFPDRFVPIEIGSDYVLGRWTDDLDVEHIQVYELLR